MQDPELSIDRAMEQYMKLGYSENWINQLLKSIEIKKELTDQWKKRGLKEALLFAISFISANEFNKFVYLYKGNY